jgi:ABC-type polysaccharide/polyol phosphate export permease
MVNLLIGFVIFFVLLFILKGAPTAHILLLPLAIVLQLMFTLSLAFFCSSGAVFFRDIPQMLSAIFMIWFWATPICYTENMIPVDFQWIVIVNPAYYMLTIYRDALFYGTIPQPGILVPFVVFTILLFIGSLWFFRKTKRGFGELL